MRKIIFGLATLAFSVAVVGDGPPLPLATPESQGVSSDDIVGWLDAVDRELNGRNGWHVHGFAIACHGRLLAEGSWVPYDTLHETHALYSHSKSFTSLAVGLAVDDGLLRLDERLVDIFPECASNAVWESSRRLCVRDLLTMSSGMPTEDDPTNAATTVVGRFLANRPLAAPGKQFIYDGRSTHILGRIVDRKAGRPMMDLLDERIFRPLGITDAWSHLAADGTAIASSGMNMSTRDLVRFGQLCLQQGRWGDRQLVSTNWIREATACHVKTRSDGTDEGYGYQFWRGPHDSYRAAGAYCQTTVVFPKYDAVVVVNADVRDMEHFFNFLWKTVPPLFREGALPEDAAAQTRLAARCDDLTFPPTVGIAGTPAAYANREFGLSSPVMGASTVRIVQTDGIWRLQFGLSDALLIDCPIGTNGWCRTQTGISAGGARAWGNVPRLAVATSGALQADGTYKCHVEIPLRGDSADLIFSPDGCKVSQH